MSPDSSAGTVTDYRHDGQGIRITVLVQETDSLLHRTPIVLPTQPALEVVKCPQSEAHHLITYVAVVKNTQIYAFTLLQVRKVQCVIKVQAQLNPYLLQCPETCFHLSMYTDSMACEGQLQGTPSHAFRQTVAANIISYAAYFSILRAWIDINMPCI
jgi:hypothetical protein